LFDPHLLYRTHPGEVEQKRGEKEGKRREERLQRKLSSNAGAGAEASSLLSPFIFHFLSIEN